MIRIVRSTDDGTTTLTVSGRISAEELPELRRAIEECGRRLVIDLGEVGVVDAETVRFLVHCEGRGILVARCPGYVREWMAREK